MSQRKPYTVENQRPRRTVNLFGRILAPRGSGRTSQMDLSEMELLSTACVRLLKSSRVALVRGEAPQELVAALSPDEEQVEALPESLPEPVLEEPAPVLEPTPEPEPAPEPVEVVAEVELEDDLVSDAPTLYSLEDLEGMTYSEIRLVAKERDLSTSGKKAVLVDRILAFQESE